MNLLLSYFTVAPPNVNGIDRLWPLITERLFCFALKQEPPQNIINLDNPLGYPNKERCAILWCVRLQKGRDS